MKWMFLIATILVACNDGGDRIHSPVSVAQKVILSDDATRDGAHDLGDITSRSTTGWIWNSLSASDSVDYYEFQLTAAKEVVIGVRAQDFNGDLFLENAYGAVIDSSVSGSTADETIIRTVLSGTYYARFHQMDSGMNDYKFRYSVGDADSTVVDSLEDAVKDITPTDYGPMMVSYDWGLVVFINAEDCEDATELPDHLQYWLDYYGVENDLYFDNWQSNSCRDWSFYGMLLNWHIWPSGGSVDNLEEALPVQSVGGDNSGNGGSVGGDIPGPTGEIVKPHMPSIDPEPATDEAPKDPECSDSNPCVSGEICENSNCVDDLIPDRMDTDCGYGVVVSPDGYCDYSAAFKDDDPDYDEKYPDYGKCKLSGEFGRPLHVYSRVHYSREMTTERQYELEFVDSVPESIYQGDTLHYHDDKGGVLNNSL